VAVRVDETAKVEHLQAQLGLSPGNLEERFRQAVSGQRWWRLGPLTEAECWQALTMIQSLGLEPLRGELRHSRMGQWRHSVFFSAVGSPTRLSFDDGSRGCSEARLVEAQPPPPIDCEDGSGIRQGDLWSGAAQICRMGWSPTVSSNACHTGNGAGSPTGGADSANPLQADHVAGALCAAPRPFSCSTSRYSSPAARTCGETPCSPPNGSAHTFWVLLRGPTGTRWPSTIEAPESWASGTSLR
jgi:hypothetical protein